MLSAFALTNCTQEIENPAQQPESAGYPFEIVASIVDTKTVNDCMHTKWAAGDQINLFHIEDNDEEVVKNDGVFTVSDLDAGTFTGNLSETLKSDADYAWYAFYPYNYLIETPVNTSKGWMPVGSKNNEKQIQEGNNSMKHIAGPNYPMAGWAETYPDEPTPSFTMYHLTSLIEVNVTNENDEALIVDEIAFTAPVNIIGTYYINFGSPWGIDNDPDAFTPSGDNYVSNTATLKVNNATALAKGESAKFYLGIKPFIAESGDKLVLSVNGYSKEINLSNEVAFRYGHIKTLNFDYDYVASEGVANATLTFDDEDKRIVSTTTQQIWAENGITLTYDKAGYNNNLAEYFNPVRFYKNTTITIEAPGNITQIGFNSASGDYFTYLKELLPNAAVSGNVVTETCDGSSKTVQYTLSTGQLRLNSVTVTYVTDGSNPDQDKKTLKSIAVTGQRTSYNVGDVFEFDGTVTAVYSDATTAIVTPSSVSAPDMSTVGSKDVTVTYTEGGITCEATYSITVNALTDTPVSTIASVLALGANATIPEDTFVEGVVISNMDLNNLTSKKGMYIQDETAALQFYLAANHTFKFGDKVKVNLSGAKVGAYNGAVQISGIALDKIVVLSSGNAVEPKTVTIADFLANKYEGQYVAIEGVQVADADLTKTFVMGGAHTNIKIEDADGKSFVVFSSKYATFGATAVPQGSGTIKGISSINNGNMQIIFAQNSDYEGMTGERFGEGNVEPEEPEIPETPVATNRADFETLTRTSTYGPQTTEAGWVLTNCAVQEGHISDSNPQFVLIGKIEGTDTWAKAACMNGKTSAVGSIESPELAGGCGTLEFDFAHLFSDKNGMDFNIDVIQNNEVVKTIYVTRTATEAAKMTKLHFSEEVSVSGTFKLKFTNNCPTKKDGNADRVSIWNLTWTGCN